MITCFECKGKYAECLVRLAKQDVKSSSLLHSSS